MNDKREKTRSAFTLVELLTVVVIISMLAALSTVALTESMQTAREIKTQGTIQKLDTAIQSIFESYGDRFDSILSENIQYSNNQNGPWSSYTSGMLSPDNEQILKMHLIRDVMRMEMPQSWAEIFDSTDIANTPKNALGTLSAYFRISNTDYYFRLVNTSPVYAFYYNEYKRFVANGGNPALGPNRASLLFLIIANLNPEALEGFGGNEIKDTDGDGLMEFVDAWGTPIYFLRWAPAFSGTDRQPDIFALSGNFPVSTTDDPNDPTKCSWGNGPNDTNLTNSSIVAGFSKASARWADPFDDADSGSVQSGWFLYPLIYSAGRDGMPGVFSESADGNNPKSPSIQGSPGTLDPFRVPFGYPIITLNSGGQFRHYDNIHNHRHSGGL